MLRPYFELSKVKQGIFGLAEKLYGIRLERNSQIPVYHPDVEAYEVYDADGRFLAVFYYDPFPRSSKQSGAWMTTYREQYRDKAGDHRPHVAVVTNAYSPQTRSAHAWRGANFASRVWPCAPWHICRHAICLA